MANRPSKALGSWCGRFWMRWHAVNPASRSLRLGVGALAAERLPRRFVWLVLPCLTETADCCLLHRNGWRHDRTGRADAPGSTAYLSGLAHCISADRPRSRDGRLQRWTNHSFPAHPQTANFLYARPGIL